TLDPRTGWWIVTSCTLAPNDVDPARVVKLAEASLASDPGSLLYRLWLGVALYRAGRFEQALRTLDEVTRSGNDWTNSEAWPVRAMTHQRLGQADEARRWLDKTRQGFEEALWDVHREPFHPYVPRRNQVDLVATYLPYRAAAVGGGGSPPADHPLRWVVQARGHACLGQLDEAATCFTHAIELQPADPTLWLARAWFFARRGRWHEAADDYAQAFFLGLPDRPGIIWDWHCHALVRLYLGDTERYRRICREALARFHPLEDPMAGQQLALICLLAPAAVPDPDVPVQLAEQAVAADPYNPWYLLTLAAARHRTGFSAEAVLYLRLALR